MTPSTTTTSRLITISVLVIVSMLALGSTALAQDAESDDNRGLNLGPRGVALGIGPEVGVEVDMYLTSHWTLGASFSGPVRGLGYPTPHPLDDCQTECKIVVRGSVFSEYLSIARFGQIGPRIGLFYTDFVESDEKTLAGTIVGPSLGFSAFFTPVRWAGVGVTPVVMPGLFYGAEFEGIEGERVVRPKVTFKLFLSIKFGDLDGPT